MLIKMREPIFRNFCFCCSLRKGALNAAYGNIVMGIIGIIISIVLLCVSVYYRISSSSEIPIIFQSKFLILQVILLLYAIFTLLSGIVFLNGINNYDHSKMILMLVSKIFSIIVSIILPFFLGLASGILAIFGILPIFMEIYTLLCLFSFYIEVKNSRILEKRVDIVY